MNLINQFDNLKASNLLIFSQQFVIEITTYNEPYYFCWI